MVQEVVLNGRPLDLDYYPSLEVGANPLRRTPIEINSKMVHGVNINGYDYPPADPSSVLYIPGLPGQGSKIWDRSKEGNDGTIHGALWKRTSQGLWVLWFDGGDDDVDCGTSTDFAFGTSSFTILVWVNTSAASGCICGKWELGLGRYILNVASGKPRFYCYGAGGNFITPAGTTDIRDNWHLVDVVRDATAKTISVSVDTVEQGTVDETTLNDLNSTTAFFLGESLAGLGHFSDLLGLVSCYNGALTASERTNHYNQKRHLFGV